MEERCSQCEDYEDLKEELEKIREDSEKETKSSLEKCECEKKKLKKQLVTVGVAVIVGGTLLGKEFVDKVASYLDSFNNVKESGSKLISEAEPSSGWSPDDLIFPTPSKPKVPYSGYSNVALSNVDFHYADLLRDNTASYSDLSTMVDPYIIEPSVFSGEIREMLRLDNNPLIDPLYYFDVEQEIKINPFEFRDPLVFDPYMSPPVPGPGALLTLAGGILLLKQKRRR